MSTQAMRGGHTARGYHRRKSLDLDLNIMPPTENRDQGEASQLAFQEAQVNQQQSVQPAMVDVEAIDDDVIESSATAFAEAKNKSRRNARKIIVDVDAEEWSQVSNNNRIKRKRDVSNQQALNSVLLINLEGSNSFMKEKPAPSKEPKFSCPICMGPLVEETSTRCGHIFCKSCIRAAIAVQSKCPSCRKRVTAKELIRVFLPGTRLE
ncbi:E3 ubiquitin-protein ligase RNF4-like [Cucurbita maxima]|uniref:E3 ubiquitin-protein ligase RNF4-like n=1 Tax=Cucurbita maxima TaxID=3661 RepID=A0A6J1K0H4_CUCMA|nr:E3 ubiquitin-protein ligase RNF4-like [Cucurbita maxima]XP_022995975.1 E3 ubiquitin-protein ligase RNF4-like [Cucurbita maxima]XP_022995977.1 E3 ubiquitin-protein ligase RNF4-like [Cucurbita maxima]XP_022995978.1 E3 ubiquitin-protein ligase RNF4-like [Cucurbita maxima]XP_022995979.1 E3 ubiquitin-protein ligase RNF4-like [Cucurbita maxima]XP_022995980.1 E3 ubiquitin-protein ligase RNF4-like [Cucurbita maxima]